MSNPSDPNVDAVLFGNRFATQEVPSRTFPETGMMPVEAMRLVAEDLALEGDGAQAVVLRGDRQQEGQQPGRQWRAPS